MASYTVTERAQRIAITRAAIAKFEAELAETASERGMAVGFYRDGLESQLRDLRAELEELEK